MNCSFTLTVGVLKHECYKANTIQNGHDGTKEEEQAMQILGPLD
jgi:hypothetical protein